MVDIEGLKQTKVLLVDDDAEYVKVTTMFLKDSGLNIDSCTNPIEALKICKKDNIDIVLLDFFMPELTGEEFVKQLREFNNKALVILQTGFSEKKPPIETLTALDIQGYHDKTKGVEELLLLTLSAIKTMRLIKLNRLQEVKLASLNYKKQLIGELSVGLINEAKDQLFSISAANKSISMNTDQFADENKVIDEANQKVGKVFSALGFESSTIVRLGDVIEIIRTLLASKVKENIVQLMINAQDDSVIIRKNVDTLIFLILETVMLMIDQDERKIKVVISGNDNITVDFDNNLTYDKEFAKKVVLLVTDKTGIKFTLKDKKAKIYSEN